MYYTLWQERNARCGFVQDDRGAYSAQRKTRIDTGELFTIFFAYSQYLQWVGDVTIVLWR